MTIPWALRCARWLWMGVWSGLRSWGSKKSALSGCTRLLSCKKSVKISAKTWWQFKHRHSLCLQLYYFNSIKNLKEGKFKQLPRASWSGPSSPASSSKRTGASLLYPLFRALPSQLILWRRWSWIRVSCWRHQGQEIYWLRSFQMRDGHLWTPIHWTSFVPRASNLYQLDKLFRATKRLFQIRPATAQITFRIKSEIASRCQTGRASCEELYQKYIKISHLRGVRRHPRCNSSSRCWIRIKTSRQIRPHQLAKAICSAKLIPKYFLSSRKWSRTRKIRLLTLLMRENNRSNCNFNSLWLQIVSR